MKDDVLKITKDIFSYNDFVNDMEINHGHLDSWFNMEILNSLALDEWDISGRPIEWNKWNEKYQKKAIELVNIFFEEKR